MSLKNCMQLGIDQLLHHESEKLRGQRIGLLTSRSHMTSENHSTLESVLARKDLQVTALFAPEHGLDLKAQYMEAVASSTDAKSNLPIFSLYGETFESLSPTSEMLSRIDTLVVDLQDIGSRYYTYIWTTLLCMHVCAQQKKQIIVCDRPNPLGGLVLEGGEIEKGFESFIGLHSIPNRHGMTIGELALLFKVQEKINCNVHVISMSGWKRSMHFPETGLTWHNPSPNMRSYTAALLYPGICLLEGTNVSEGRGTETPFEIIGAPFIRPDELIEHMEALEIPAIDMEAISFTPTFEKWKGTPCEGIKWTITNHEAFRSYLNGFALIWTLHKLYKRKGFEWRTSPYEFRRDVPAIDVLTGSSEFRKRIDTKDFEEIIALADFSSTFAEERKQYFLYS
ncbi:MAG: hypothetical protein A3C46_01445 [Deltaproteobacteria bacterium RIFCSPHIGHO2_02_FULL_44_16]|nr:MAG: hypothetical protein A3C46_01445 [Deltaproteobacteria bacterium RIFCSPHIGHO2_02_FULL_44_16]